MIDQAIAFSRERTLKALAPWRTLTTNGYLAKQLVVVTC
jgi:hypothetical protein